MRFRDSIYSNEDFSFFMYSSTSSFYLTMGLFLSCFISNVQAQSPPLPSSDTVQSQSSTSSKKTVLKLKHESEEDYAWVYVSGEILSKDEKSLLETKTTFQHQSKEYTTPTLLELDPSQSNTLQPNLPPRMG